MNEKKYEIGGKTYVQRPLVLGQIRQLLAATRDIEIPAVFAVETFLEALGDRLPLALAVVLTEEGRSPKDKDIGTLAGEIEFTIGPDILLEVIADFFTLNPVYSLLRKTGETIKKIGESRPTEETGSMIS